MLVERFLGPSTNTSSSNRSFDDRIHLHVRTSRARGRVYFLAARAQPDFDTPEEFAVTVYHNDTEPESNVEIARIDTAHNYTHFDRLYRRDGPKERLDVDSWEAIERLEDNWRTYAAGYERTH